MKSGLVLIADDNETVRTMYATALEAAGLAVITAENGKTAIAQALEHHPAVILIDIMMPDLNGHQVVKKIRTDSWGKHARFIYLTNLSDPEHVVKAIEQGSEKYIVKANTEVKEVVNQVRIAMHT